MYLIRNSINHGLEANRIEKKLAAPLAQGYIPNAGYIIKNQIGAGFFLIAERRQTHVYSSVTASGNRVRD
jgi:hypothetical protein